MKYRLLGHTGLYVSEMCLGGMTYGNEGFWKVMGGLGQQAVNELIKFAFDAGINFIDTANVYSLGKSEIHIGQAIKELGLPREELVVATKATGIMNELPNGRGQSRYHLMNEVDASLRRLQLDHIDLYQLHGFDPLTPLEESMACLNDLVRSGKVRYIGVCNMAAWQVMKTLSISEHNHWPRISSVQAYYTIAGRDIEREMIPLLKDQHLGLMVWSPLAGGLLTGKFSPDGKGPPDSRRSNFDFPVVDRSRVFNCIDIMRPMAEKRQISIAQIALAWLLMQPAISSVIIGARNLEQLKDNIAATDISLSEEEYSALNKISQLSPEYPGWMLDMQGKYRDSPPIRIKPETR
ncbi:MAG TPA: aldo/keto reductase [Burkholderiales bacterium]|nr:aldo/keto reductase [Burkholderiales bacterium]